MGFDKVNWLMHLHGYKINEDGTIDVEGNATFSMLSLVELPIRFGRVTGDFWCSFNNLTSLEGCPRWVGGNFSCNVNNLTTLQHAPEYVGGNFMCECNKLNTLEHMPGYIGGNVGIKCNPGNFTAEYINEAITKAKNRKYIKTLSYDDEIEGMGSIFD